MSPGGRKTVTIVFSDVVGSTTLGERLDPEAMRFAMSRYFDALREVIERHGGTVEKFVGDAVMAVFGIPQLHEDDALRAVRAAVAMSTAAERVNHELERELRVRIASRTGINTGRGRYGPGPDACDRRRRQRRRAAGAGSTGRRHPPRHGHVCSGSR
jgi:class 3 adenylate cyclase